MISAVVLSRNEENNILDCLETILWCDEIIVIDDFSEDRTEEVIKHLNSPIIKLFKKRLENDFSGQRNFALAKAKKEWVLFVDADERIPNELRREINDFIIEEKREKVFDGMYFFRKDVLWGKILKHGETGNIKLLRLARKNAGLWQGRVHEEWIVAGKVGEFENSIIHYPHQTISEFLRKINFYTTIRAKELFDNGESFSLVKIIFYPKGKFIQNYFFKLGILDGIEGLILAVLMSLHSYLVRAKLWVYLNKKF